MPEAGSRPGTRRPSTGGAAALTYGTNVGAALLSLVNVLVVARVLGPSGRGDVAFVIAVVTFTAALAACGIQEANANLGARNPHARAALASNSVVFALAFGVVAACVVALLTAVIPSVGGDVDRTWLLVALVGIPIAVLKVYLQFLVQAEYGFAATNLAWIAGPLTTALTNGTLAALGVLSVGSAVIAWVGGQTLGTTILLLYISRHSGFGRLDGALARTAVIFGAKTHLGRSLALGNYRIDQWFVGAIAGSRELGFYSVAVAWVEALYYIPGVLCLIQRPDLARAPREEAAWRSARFFRVALILSLSAAAVLIVLAPFLCATIYGAQFSSSVDDLRILAMAAFGIVAMEILGNALVAQRRPLLSTGPIAAAFLVTIVLDILLIPRYGGAGAAVATSVAWTVGGITVIMAFRRALGTTTTRLMPRLSDGTWLLRKARAAVAGALSRRGGLSP